MAREQTAILFRRALGFTDSPSISTQIMKTDPRDRDGAGDTEFIDCLNVTITPDGCVEKIPSFTTALETGSPLTTLSAGSRFLFSDGVDTKEWLGGSTVANRFPVVAGPIAHTLLDARVSTVTKNYKSTNAAPAVLTEALVGASSGPATSVTFSAMPLFKQAFIYNSKLYLVNRTDPRFIQYSEDYAYDLYNLGDNHIGSKFAVLQAGAIPGVVVSTHEEGVTVYRGMTPLGDGFERKFYPCAPIDNTLYSGFISKIDGHAHVFLCADGVYTVGDDGVLKNMTINQTAQLGMLNASYAGAVAYDGKYRALGNLSTLEYCFRAKALVKQAPQSVTAACVWGGVPYFAVGSQIVKFAASDAATQCFVTLPYSDLSALGRKSFRGLYFTGTANGSWAITATDQAGESWTIERDDEFENVTGQYIKTPKGFLGNHISLKIECLSGSFRLEELRAVVTASDRSR